jgi:hypothetical protein
VHELVDEFIVALALGAALGTTALTVAAASTALAAFATLAAALVSTRAFAA